MLVPRSDCPATGPCRHRLVVSERPDETPPTRATIAELRTLLVEDPNEAGAFTCGDLDVLRIGVAGTDDTTPREHLTLLAFLAPTAEEALAKPDPDVASGFDLGPPGRALASSVRRVASASSRGRSSGESVNDPSMGFRVARGKVRSSASACENGK